MITVENTRISTLGPCRVRSPLGLSSTPGDGIGNFTPDHASIRYQVESDKSDQDPRIAFEKAGPREMIYFKPAETRAAIVTCGGLCPGLNNVIRSAFLELYCNYGVPEILGLRYGFEGLNPACGHQPVRLTMEMVDHIIRQGGTILGSSRGAQKESVMVDFLQKEGINILLCVGGDGTQRGTHALAQEVARRKADIAVVGIPKTIDNDISFVRQTFGFFTAVEVAREVLEAAHNEAKGAPNGIGLVKLMGRDSGFIAVFSTLASQEVNFTLIPEVPLRLDGSKGFLHALQARMLSRHHAVVVVAEGAGQNLMPGDMGHDASGNRLQKDIGVFLKNEIARHFAEQKIPVNIKYFDPSYIIRSVGADAEDSLLCDHYARTAVHAAMAGKTDMLIGMWYGCFIHVPIALATAARKTVSPESELWSSLLAATGQPRAWG